MYSSRGEVSSGSSSLLARPLLVRENHPAALLGTVSYLPVVGFGLEAARKRTGEGL